MFRTRRSRPMINRLPHSPHQRENLPSKSAPTRWQTMPSALRRSRESVLRKMSIQFRIRLPISTKLWSETLARKTKREDSAMKWFNNILAITKMPGFQSSRRNETVNLAIIPLVTSFIVFWGCTSAELTERSAPSRESLQEFLAKHEKSFRPSAYDVDP